MKRKSKHTKNDFVAKNLAVFMVAILFFALIVEAFHHHDTYQSDPATTASIVKYAPQCVICEVITNQANTSFIGQDFTFEINPPLVFIEQPFDAYQLHFYQPTLQTSKNKGPPSSNYLVA